MKKKISLLLCILLATTFFVGCSNNDTTISEEQKTSMISQSELLVDMCSNTENYFGISRDEYIEQIEQYPEFDMNVHINSLNYSLSQYNMNVKVGAEEYVGIFKAWDAAVEECGNFEKVTGDFVFDKDKLTVSAEGKFKDRSATIMFSYDENGRIKSLDVSAMFSMGEILSKAGLNTLLGMGTVFAVLIFLALIISTLKYIPMLLDKSAKKSSETVTDTKEVVEETVCVDESDDLELIAVITAAIAAQEGTSTDGFVVRSIRRRPSNNWN